MTNRLHSPKSRRTSLVARLQRSEIFYRRLSVVSSMCESDSQWMMIHKARWIPLLDFDVICGALPSVAIRQRVESGPPDDEERSSLLSGMPGPHVVRQIVDSMNDLCLPPGSIMDLLHWKDRKVHTISKQARRFLEWLHAAASLSNPEQALQNLGRSHTKALGVVRDELSGLATRFADLALLDEIMDRCTPVESLMADRRQVYHVEAYRSTLGQLKLARPQLTYNNINDALNVAVAVRIFNNPSLIDGLRWSPVLISQTRKVTNLSIEENWFAARWRQRPRLISNNLYLIVSQGLALRSGGNCRNVADEARLLHARAAEIANWYVVLLDGMGASSTDHVTVDDLPDYEFEMLEHQISLFERDWGSLFRPLVAAQYHDRAVYLDTLLAPDVAQLIGSTDVSTIQAGLNRLLDVIMNYSHPLCDFIKDSVARSRRGNIPLAQFDIGVGENDGTLLWDMPRTLDSVGSVQRSEFLRGRGKRIFVRFTSLNWPYLAVDIRRASPMN